MADVTDLAAWLTQVWDEQEKAAREDLEIVSLARLGPEYTLTYQWSRQLVNANGLVVSSMFSSGAPTPTEVLARIAADRQILAACVKILAVDGWEYSDAPDLAEATLRLLAQPYRRAAQERQDT